MRGKALASLLVIVGGTLLGFAPAFLETERVQAENVTWDSRFQSDMEAIKGQPAIYERDLVEYPVSVTYTMGLFTSGIISTGPNIARTLKDMEADLGTRRTGIQNDDVCALQYTTVYYVLDSLKNHWQNYLGKVNELYKSNDLATTKRLLSEATSQALFVKRHAYGVYITHKTWNQNLYSTCPAPQWVMNLDQTNASKILKPEKFAVYIAGDETTPVNRAYLNIQSWYKDFSFLDGALQQFRVNANGTPRTLVEADVNGISAALSKAADQLDANLSGVATVGSPCGPSPSPLFETVAFFNYIFCSVVVFIKGVVTDFLGMSADFLSLTSGIERGAPVSKWVAGILPSDVETPFQQIMLDPNSAVGLATKAGYDIVLRTLNSILIIVLIALALANILQIQINTYSVKKILPGLIIGFIAAHFSYLGMAAMIEVSGQLSTGLIDVSNIPGVNTGAARATGLEAFVQAFSGVRDANGEVTFYDTDPETTSGTGQTIITARYIQQGFLNIFIVVAAVMMFILGFLFAIRWIIFTIAIPLAPLAVFGAFFPPLNFVWKRWSKFVSGWLFMPLIAIFWLWVAMLFFAGVNGNGGSGFLGYLVQYAAGVVFLFAAIKTPFSMAGEAKLLMDKWNGMGKSAWNITGKQAIDYSGGSALKRARTTWADRFSEREKLKGQGPILQGNLSKTDIGRTINRHPEQYKMINTRMAADIKNKEIKTSNDARDIMNDAKEQWWNPYIRGHGKEWARITIEGMEFEEKNKNLDAHDAQWKEDLVHGYLTDLKNEGLVTMMAQTEAIKKNVGFMEETTKDLIKTKQAEISAVKKTAEEIKKLGDSVNKKDQQEAESAKIANHYRELRMQRIEAAEDVAEAEALSEFKYKETFLAPEMQRRMQELQFKLAHTTALKEATERVESGMQKDGAFAANDRIELQSNLMTANRRLVEYANKDTLTDDDRVEVRRIIQGAKSDASYLATAPLGEKFNGIAQHYEQMESLLDSGSETDIRARLADNSAQAELQSIRSEEYGGNEALLGKVEQRLGIAANKFSSEERSVQYDTTRYPEILRDRPWQDPVTGLSVFKIVAGRGAASRADRDDRAAYQAMLRAFADKSVDSSVVDEYKNVLGVLHDGGRFNQAVAAGQAAIDANKRIPQERKAQEKKDLESIMNDARSNFRNGKGENFLRFLDEYKTMDYQEGRSEWKDLDASGDEYGEGGINSGLLRINSETEKNVSSMIRPARPKIVSPSAEGEPASGLDEPSAGLPPGAPNQGPQNPPDAGGGDEGGGRGGRGRRRRGRRS